MSERIKDIGKDGAVLGKKPDAVGVMIPLPLAVWGLYGVRMGLLRTYLLLRGMSGGTGYLSSGGIDYGVMGEELGVSERTVRNRVKRLVEMKWIHVGESGGCWIKGLKRVADMVGGRFGRTGVWVDSGEGVGMKARVLTGLIAYMNGVMNRRHGASRGERQEGLHVGGLSLGYIGKVLGRSRSWAWKWVKEMVKRGWLWRNLRWVEVDLSVEELGECRSNGDLCEAVRNMRVSRVGGNVYEFVSSEVGPRIGVRYEVRKKRGQ